MDFLYRKINMDVGLYKIFFNIFGFVMDFLKVYFINKKIKIYKGLVILLRSLDLLYQCFIYYIYEFLDQFLRWCFFVLLIY